VAVTPVDRAEIETRRPSTVAVLVAAAGLRAIASGRHDLS
jgi:hypothetical protein